MNVDEIAIAQFLTEFKSLMSTYRDFFFVPRIENNATVIKLGLNETNLRKELFELSVIDYCSGPENDLEKPGVVWIFGKEINGFEIYLKLKIVDLHPGKLAKCISFHFADHPLTYPFGNK